jgi:glutamate decarboxylase
VKSLTNASHGQRGKHTHLGPASSLTPYSSRYAISAPSKHKIPQDGAPGEAVAQMIRDELDLDGRPNLNLASFVGTYMDKEV